MNSEKFAKTIYHVNDLSKIRWSPRAFAGKPVEKEKIRSILEAARWSPSAGNEQPWRFMIGFREDETWRKIFETLDEGNKVWVRSDHQPLTAIALGYIGDSSSLPDDLKEGELAERKRKDFDELIFSGTFGQKSNLFYEK